VGPFDNVPQRSLQDNHQVRYDGALAFGRHSVRWGTSMNLVRMKMFVTQYSTDPALLLLVTGATGQGCKLLG